MAQSIRRWKLWVVGSSMAMGLLGLPCRADLVAHYTFDVDARDETGRHDGELVDDAFAGVMDTGRPTGVLELDGATGYVAVPDADDLDLTVDFSIAAWINVWDTSTSHIVRKIADGESTEHLYVLRTQADTLRFFVGDEFGISSNLISDPAPFEIGEWQFVAATFDGEEQAIYVNDSTPLATMEAIVTEAQVSDTELRIGRGSPAGFFGGWIDDVWLFDHVLSADEIDALIAGLPVDRVVLQAGDANQDLDFNQLDLVQVQIAAKYLTGQAATWGEGDWNAAPGGEPGDPPQGDGVFDQLDIIAALAAGVYLTGPYAALQPGGQSGDGTTSVGYDANTGEVWVDAPGGRALTSINIDSAAGVFRGQPAQNLGGSFDNDTDDNIFKATFGSSFPSLSFGPVAQPELTEEFLLSDLTVVGSLDGGGGLGDVDLIYVPVPEPSSLILGAMAAGMATLLRRRDATRARRRSG